jgi:hypothetical protein
MGLLDKRHSLVSLRWIKINFPIQSPNNAQESSKADNEIPLKILKKIK